MLIEHEQAIAHISHCDVDRRGGSCRHIGSAGRKGCLEQALGHEKGESLLRRSVFSGLFRSGPRRERRLLEATQGRVHGWDRQGARETGQCGWSGSALDGKNRDGTFLLFLKNIPLKYF